ncbi:DUF4145 domain-containing protein [Vibrio sp. S234-5]|uniref:DUF4145 domain-containing protein n=1 Tax=Vibrio sp. S234-5 TaxID=1616781 RepID=UPI000A5DB2D0|nr:DUF4145 domain-containing protein [Vibrio sp. S234-5]
MSKELIDVFCPDCNMMVVSDVVLQGVGRFQSEAKNPLDEVDSIYHSDYYLVSLCKKCDHPFFIRKKLMGIPAEFEEVVEEELLYPVLKSTELVNLPNEINLAYEQATKCFSASLYEPCALMCRRALEIMCKLYSAKGHNFYDRLESLHKAGHIDARLLSWAHGIRALGNDAAHAITANVSKEDAKDCLDLTEALLIYIYSLGHRFEEFELRRQKN